MNTPVLKSYNNIEMEGTSVRISSEPLIVSRVKKYLYENGDKVYIDVNAMADSLQKRYRDYQSKKRGTFRAMVRDAYNEISENINKHRDSMWEEEDDSEIDSVLPIETIEPDFSKKRPLSHVNGNSSDKELIDISSDDEKPSSTHKNDRICEPIIQEAKRPHLMSSNDSQPSKPKALIKVQAEAIKAESKTDNQISQGELNNRKKSRAKIKNSDDEAGTMQKMPKRDFKVSRPTTTFTDIGGNIKVLEIIANMLIHIENPTICSKLGISPARGFLLHGPPGCGKSLLAEAIAGEFNTPLLKVASPELIGGVSGESESKIRDLFEQAVAIAPCLLFLDEIDCIAPHRAFAQREMERRMVSQLLSCLDELGKQEKGNKVLVIGATNRPEAIDPALRLAGRFDRELSLGIPDEKTRAAILKIHTKNVRISPEVDLLKIAELTPGYVGADLVALIREASIAAVTRVNTSLSEKSLVATEKQELSEKENVNVDVEGLENDTEENTNEVVLADVQPSQSVTEPVGDSETDIAPVEIDKVPDEEEKKKDAQENSDKTVEGDSQQNEAVNEKEVTKNIESSDEEQKKNDSVDLNQDKETPMISSDSPIESEMKVIESNKSNKQIDPVKNLLNLRELFRNNPSLIDDLLPSLYIESTDFNVALKNVQPCAKREGFATVPDVTWDDVGSLQDIREELQMTILAPIRHSEHFESLGLTTPTGVLLCGPPGCGKTLIAKAIANEAGINFISVKGPELLNMYVGESEKAVRQCFVRARDSAPCVIFFDELDALCPKRAEGDNNASTRVVNQMLTEMDGVEERKGVFLMAASNRPDIIDPAVLRPGRLDKILYVGLPTVSDRVDILRALTKNGTKPKLAADVDLEVISRSERCEGFTGADLAALVREAGTAALRDIMKGVVQSAEVNAQHFQIALEKVRPSVREVDKKRYEKLRKLYSQNVDVIPMETPIDSPTLRGEPLEAMET